MQNEIKCRFSQKHDIEANWIKAGQAKKPFIPLNGELIAYDPDENYSYTRIKFGDGITNVNELPFVNVDADYVQTEIENLQTQIDALPTADEVSNATVAKATKATRLETARTITVGNAVLAGAKSFDGQNNIDIPINFLSENYVGYPTSYTYDPRVFKHSRGSVTPIDAANISELSGNRLAFMDPAGIQVEYSTDGGTTWVDYGLSDTQKQSLVTLQQTITTGGPSAIASEDNKLRVTITAHNNYNLYFKARKILLLLSTEGVTVCKALIERASIGSETDFVTMGEFEVAGWSGWNSIPWYGDAAFGGSDGQTGQWRHLRITLSVEGINENYSSIPCLYKIRMLGETMWNGNNIAKNNSLFSYDIHKNATFPAQITATQFNGNATKDGDGNVITDTYATISALDNLETSLKEYIDSQI